MNDNLAYFSLYYTVVFGLLCISIVYIINEYRGIRVTFLPKIILFLLLFSSILLFGYRPYMVGTDTLTYLSRFQDAKYWTIAFSDFGFGLLVKMLAPFISVRFFFIICACLLVFPIYASYYSIFKKRLLLPLLMLYCSYFFIQYGVNIIRSGIAFSFFLCVIINKNDRILQIVFSFIACSFHLSLLLPVVLWFIYSNSTFFISMKITLLIWFICLLLLFLSVSIPCLSTVLEIIDFESVQARMDNYIQMDNSSYKTGVRYDFISFSFAFLVIGLFLRKKIYTDAFYEIILKIYITANAFFLLSSNIPYSDRYGTLSWSLIPILYSYPLLKSAKNSNIFILYAGISGMFVLSLFINLY